jgi:hypothetical protein
LQFLQLLIKASVVVRSTPTYVREIDEINASTFSFASVQEEATGGDCLKKSFTMTQKRGSQARPC